jgi:hypothetical protein
MNRNELRRKLKKDKIIEDMYSLDGGLPNEKLCLNEKEECWEVYYSERGRKTGLKTFSSEESACIYFYETISKLYRDLKKLKKI